MDVTEHSPAEAAVRGALWVALVSVASVGFSLALACAMPFAAVAALGGTQMSARGAAALTAIAWFANQLVGYFILDYPTTWDSFAWGAIIGIAALLAVVAVSVLSQWLRLQWAALAVGFLLAFALYEVTLYAATAFLPSGDEAFSFAVVADIFWTNVAAFVALYLVHRLALAMRIVSGRDLLPAKA